MRQQRAEPGPHAAHGVILQSRADAHRQTHEAVGVVCGAVHRVVRVFGVRQHPARYAVAKQCSGRPLPARFKTEGHLLQCNQRNHRRIDPKTFLLRKKRSGKVRSAVEEGMGIPAEPLSGDRPVSLGLRVPAGGADLVGEVRGRGPSRAHHRPGESALMHELLLRSVHPLPVGSGVEARKGEPHRRSHQPGMQSVAGRHARRDWRRDIGMPIRIGDFPDAIA